MSALPSEKQLFSSLSVKLTKEVVSLDLPDEIRHRLSSSESGKYLEPDEFHHFLKSMDNHAESNIKLIDIRNQYEVRIGKFQGDNFDAINPETRQFSDIVRYLDF